MREEKVGAMAGTRVRDLWLGTWNVQSAQGSNIVAVARSMSLSNMDVVVITETNINSFYILG